MGIKIALPALSWATDLSPLIQFDIEPVLIDCNMEDLSLDLSHLEDELENDPGIGAVLIVHVLGLVPDVLKIQRICEKHDVILLEDACEAMEWAMEAGLTNLDERSVAHLDIYHHRIR